MRVVVLFFFFFLFLHFPLVVPQQHEVSSVSGGGKKGIEFKRGVSLKLPFDLSTFLGDSFTFECWINLPNPEDSVVKPIIYRGPGTANHHNEFLFMVSPEGKLTFFMGDGNSATVYGLLFNSVSIKKNAWTHVGFGLSTEQWKVNPTRITIFVDGTTYEESWKSAGSRQYRPDKPIFVGTYANPDFHWYTGSMDELRFWDEYRSQEQIRALRNLPPSLVAHLRAYYDCNGLEVKYLRDKTKNKFDAQILRSTSTGEGLQLVPSGVKIHQLISFAYELDVKRIFQLEPLEKDLTYFLETLPSQGTLMDGLRNKFDVSNLPIKLESNDLSYDTTTTPSLTYFRVYGARRRGEYYVRAEEQSTIIYIKTDLRVRDNQNRVSISKPYFCVNTCSAFASCKMGL